MAKYIFLYRANNEDCDACAYLEDVNFENRFVCGHYFAGLNLNGACYSGGEFLPYNEIETVLTESEYNTLLECKKDFAALGYGIKPDTPQYQKGMAICERLEPIFKKLKSEEGEEFFARIVESEKEFVAEEYNLSAEDVDTIFNDYANDYQDRGIVGYVYDDAEEVGRHYADDCYNVPDNLSPYFDYEKFGWDIVNDGDFVELSDGRIVEYNY